MISACTDQHQQDPLIERYMMLPNQVWDDIINQASKNVDVLKDHVSFFRFVKRSSLMLQKRKIYLVFKAW